MSQAVTKSDTTVTDSSTNSIINDVVIKIATVNGSGSQSANLILMRSIFRMGIPVSSKNLFPSNISGLPTWFTIRASEEGWMAQKNATDISILMNKQTVSDDLAELNPGTVVIMNDSLKSFIKRDDLSVYLVPFDSLVKEASPDTRLRKKVVNVPGFNLDLRYGARSDRNSYSCADGHSCDFFALISMNPFHRSGTSSS